MVIILSYSSASKSDWVGVDQIVRRNECSFDERDAVAGERAGKSGSSGQLIYSLINLDSAVEKAKQAYRAYMLDLAKTGGYSDLPPITFPNSICVPTNTTVKGESMPEAMKRDLARLVGSQSLASSSSLKVQVPAGEL